VVDGFIHYEKVLPKCTFLPAKSLLIIVLFLSIVGALSPDSVYAYADTTERPVFLAWPLPTSIGLARISLFSAMVESKRSSPNEMTFCHY
jgi:hypothetical protein